MRTLYFCPVVSSFFYLFISSPILNRHRLDVYHTWCDPSANLECRSETCCTQLIGNAGPKNRQTWAPSHNLSGYIFATEARIDNLKKLVKQQYLPICPYNIVNIGLLAAELVSLVWGTPANFNGFRVLAALLHGTLVLGVSETLRR